MNGSFDFGILILGLGVLAFVVGLGAWIWEILNKSDVVSSTDTKLDPTKPARAIATTTGSTPTEVNTTQLTSTFLKAPAEAPVPTTQHEATQQILFITPPQIPKTPKRTPPFPSLFSKLLKS
jgi:hypothetical protein